MRVLISASIAVLLCTAAHAEPSNSTPHARECMRQNGFTYAEWRAYKVPADKAEPYRLCRDSGGRKDARNVKANCLSQAGVTAAQWKAKRASESQGMAYKNCMAENGIQVTVHRRNGSSF